MVVFVFCIFLTIKCVHNAAIIPASQDINDPVKQFEGKYHFLYIECRDYVVLLL